ncbi:MAG: protein kinase [Candidatus Sulfopaludibacter sp.]|nr:protein kinase [Candidatus Sulfopaludibacter sp.]
MTPERWQQIEVLYHSARERGLAVLEGTDPDLRREVVRLLEQDSEGKFLDRPAVEMLGDLAATGQTAAAQMGLTGRTISHYQIHEMLGAGGMGVVYKAFDTKLNRFVALKFLPAHLRHDEELKRQLAGEARAASALDHPNIVVVHDIDDSADLFIAMAYHQGVTLREKIALGLTLPEALQIARQIASGLAKAHEHGIFHRDIKPGNVIVAKDGIARIIDFGLARFSAATVTLDGAVRGTPLYMSPEQASGKAVDFRTDLWSLGAVLYEMLAGKPPFPGETQLQVIRAVVHDEPPRLRDIPPAVEAIVTRALQKDPARRYRSAAEMVEDLSAALAALEAPPTRRPRWVAPAAVLLLLAAGASLWFYLRSEKRHWAREQAIPEIRRLMVQNQTIAAYRELQEAQRYLSGDAPLAEITESLVHTVSVRSSPPGATVEIRNYLSPGDPWFPLGKTPLEKVKIPAGYMRWRVSKPGAGTIESAPIPEDIHGYIREFNFPLDAAASAPEGMLPVPVGETFSIVWSLGDVGPFRLPLFYVDKFEVTNRQYQEFVDRGGYRNRAWWKEKFVRDGQDLTWEQAMDLFRDSTGRSGPATWAAGHYPSGQEEYPVGGVSWYEASAYAEFAGKSLPVIAQWFLLAPSSVARSIQPLSNFSPAPAPVGKYQGLGPFGTYDMAGNIAEWCRTASGGGTRYLLGGGWNTTTNEYFEPGAMPPFNRSANSGFRCVRNTGPLPAEATAERRQTIRDFSKAQPAPEPVFRVYQAMYSYDRTPLNAKVEKVVQDSPDWRKEKITFDAAYGNERMAAYLFVPAHVKPPYQAVVFFPSARVLDLPSSDTLGDTKFIDFVIQSGRAVLYPVIKGTYERSAPLPGLDTVAGRETIIDQSKDLGRSIDYLETRADIDRNRIAYMGVSMTAAQGVIYAALEPRLKAVIFLDGGFFTEKPLPGTDQADFAPHIKAPTLLVCGKFDWIFLGKDALLRMLGAPAADKSYVLLDTAHDVSEERPALMKAVIGWLDKYLGKVE